ncbi:MAG: 50S ribosomal protein L6 [Nitrospirae bacterium]|nr:50S ribosomal protein L6 [Nitrospirota bacterium]
MSRIGKKPIGIPKGVDVKVSGSEVAVKGPKGEIKKLFSPYVGISAEGDAVTVTRTADTKQVRALHGTTRSILASMIKGVSEGYERTLEITGIGYRAQAQAKKVMLTLGYSHPVEYALPEGITAQVDPKQTLITLKGIDKQVIGQVAANLRALRSPDAYKGKGIRYSGERIKLKAGKTGKK